MQTNPTHPAQEENEDGYRIYSKNLELGIWYNFPPLHQFIIKRYADGIDNGIPVPLSVENMIEIMHKIHANDLPHTPDLFAANGSTDMRYTIDIFECAIRWVQAPDHNHTRAASYIAHWQK